jgi:hypothetical protein
MSRRNFGVKILARMKQFLRAKALLIWKHLRHD